MSIQPPSFASSCSRRSLLKAGQAVGSLAVVTLPLAACLPGSSTPSTAPPSPTRARTPQTTPSPSPAATSNPLVISDVEADTEASWSTGSTSGPGEGSCGVEVDMRTGVHEGYDRVVVEMSGDGTPGWWADWVDVAVSLGKGEPVAVSGQYLLSVIGSGTQVPSSQAEWDQLFKGPTQVTVGGLAVSEVWFDHTFESEFQVVIGTGSQSYRVFTLSTPTRLVIDVAHP